MLLDQIENLHQRFLETPEDCAWGDPKAIWPGGQHPYAGAPELAPAIDAFEQVALASAPDLSDEAIEVLRADLDRLRALEPGQAWSREVKDFIERKLASEPKRGSLQLTRKKTGWLELTGPVRAARRSLLDALYADIYNQLLERSRGLYTFVAQYESVYAGAVRQAGLISFSDITTLLAERAAQAEGIDALDWRAQVAYRIDQKFDHWLLDEFQDTSRTQWSILRTFIDEVVMDGGGQRSFFYVGDTKQAIYGWRGGDADLFQEIAGFYGEGLHTAPPLADSWRSAPPVIELVNKVFGDMDSLAEPLKLPDQTVAKWQQSWNHHAVAPPLREKIGYAAWVAVEAADDDEAPAQHLAVRRILEEVRPLEKGIECAVLLRKNKELSELAAYLQSKGIPVAVEGKSNPCTDNPLGTAVLAALRAAAHPGDTRSIALLQGMPCAQAWGADAGEAFREATLQAIAEQGFAPTIQDWVSRAGLDEPFLQDRADTLIAAAETFDAQRNPGEGIDAFIHYIESLEAQEAEARDAIRLMTIHQAKGLGFAMVIVAGLDGNTQSRVADELVLGPDRKTPHWGLLLPRKEIAEQDPVLGPQSTRLAAEAKTDELCNAYVALTRAKRALYVISDALNDPSQASHFGQHLKLTLDPDWQSGDPNWFDSDA
jgi:ATP-dependent exoDNAse (exonuclease V) beta subunit